MTEVASEPKKCPQCGKPELRRGGSFTQWIFDLESCSCGKPTSRDEDRSSRQFCLTCRGAVEGGRVGSITQWIFTAGKVCKCATANLGLKETIETPHRDLRQDEDVELSLDPTAERHFPLDRYSPIQELGRGANSTVYLCRDKLLRKRVCVKVLKNLSDKQLMAFQNEARSTSNLKHPAILTLIDFGPTTDGTPYMVQEYFPGITLQEYLEQHGPLTMPQFCLVFENLALALGHAHSKEIMHRDIKPSNILVHAQEIQTTVSSDESSPPVRLIDFGLASFTGNNDDGRDEQSASMVGTPAYMAPDTACLRPYDERSEIYALGCVMFECLTSQQLFQANTALEILQMHASVEPPSLSEVTKTEWPDQVELLIARCLSKAPEKRFSSMDALRKAIAELPLTNNGEADIQQRDDTGKFDRTTPRFSRAAYAITYGATFLFIGSVVFILVSPVLQPHEPDRKRSGQDKTSRTQKVAEELNSFAEIKPAVNLTKHTQHDEIENNMAMANRYYHGRGVPQDYAAAFKLFVDVAKTGNALAQESVGYMLERGLGVDANPAAALSWYEKSAKQGNPVAQLNLGTLYLEGRGTSTNYKEALEWFTLSAKQGNARAQNNIGYMYEKGFGVKRDYKESIKLYRDAGIKGEPMAYVNLGYLYECGLGAHQDYKEALRCYQLAAKSDIASGLRRLARLILVGHGTKVDFNEAYRLFLRAANKGDATAMRWLGFMTFNGQAVAADKYKAFLWYQKGAALNDAESQHQLGRMYENGWGTKADLKQAMFWYQESAARGESLAAKDLETLKRKAQHHP